MTHALGNLKFYLVSEGFGFAIPETGGNDVFLHASRYAGDAKPSRDLRDKTLRVSYVLEEGRPPDMQRATTWEFVR